MDKKSKRFFVQAVTLSAVPLLTSLWLGVQTARADSFELAMVIKETTNPYYNATLAGARIAAGEIGGTANNYGPTQSSGKAQVDIINNLADRHVPAIAVAPSDPDAVVPAMKRAQKLGAKVITFDADSAPERLDCVVPLLIAHQRGQQPANDHAFLVLELASEHP